MRKILFLLLIPAFFSAVVVVSTEQEVSLTEEQKYELNGTIYGTYHTSLPTNPNVYRDLPTFKDESLKNVSGRLQVNKSITIKSLQVNAEGIPVFQLTDGRFIAADKREIYDDVILSIKSTHQIMWLQPSFKVFHQPFVNGTKEVKTSLAAYTPVTVEKIAETITGEYASIESKGWVSLDDLSPVDNRMDKVQEILNSKYQKNDYSIYVKQVETGKTAEINGDTKMYSASITKLPILYYAQKQINEKKYSLNSSLKYIPAVNEYSGAYETAGTGNLSKTPDNKEYTIQDLINRIAKESDNAATNILGYYITNQSDKLYQSTIEQLAGEKWNVEQRNASARMAGKVMEAIYEQNGEILTALLQTNFDQQRISKNIPVTVAHKIGDAYDYKHDVAIVYTDSPFILSIFTNHSNYDTITQIADDVYEVLK